MPRQRYPVLPRVRQATKKAWTRKVSTFQRRSRKAVIESMREFTKDRYGVDVHEGRSARQHEVCRRHKVVQGRKSLLEARGDDLFFRDAANVATKPFIYLSAGVSNNEFSESLELAAESGVKFNGVLCGTRHLERRHSCLRKTGSPGVPQMAGNRRRKKY
jgi:tagatose-1,6-bisphosphate aldolase